ncbi:MAG: autotransporter-associated beta strand repeat-containing protein [Candidatus Methylacidiphilales bacterium]|nr:autotransporter-associated beta strand repeat-containing protein [Candidatus Methylacidiphilales bacterium]
MKNSSNALMRQVNAAVIVSAVFAFSSTLQAQTWDGGGLTDASWGNATNWTGDTLPTFNAATDVTFSTNAGLSGNTTWLGVGRTIRSITFGADVDGTFALSLSANATSTADARLTFGNATNQAFIDVLAGSTANITIGNPLSLGFSGSPANSFQLGSNLIINHNGSGVLTFNRPISTTSSFSFTKNGTGTFQIFNNSGITGSLNVNQGTFIAGFSGSANEIVNYSAVNLNGGTLQFATTGTNKVYGNSTTGSANWTVTGNSTLAYNNNSTTSNAAGALAGNGTLNLNGNLTVQNISSNQSLTNRFDISRNITGTGNLVVNGYNYITSNSTDFSLGRLEIGGNNTLWSGDAIIRQGSLSVYGNSTLGQVNLGTGKIVFGETGNSAGAALLLSPAAGSGNKQFVNDIIVRAGGFRTIRGGSDHTYTFTGNVSLEGDLNIHNGLFFTDKNMIFSGNITGVGGVNITESGNPGFVRFSGTNNTYSGATTIGTNATLNINSATGQAIGDSSAVSFTGANSLLQFNSANETIGSLASSGTDGAVNLGSRTLTTGGNNQSTSYGGSISGTGGLTKLGNGTFTLAGNNTYTGTTTVSAGTLLIASTATFSSTNVTIATGATFDASALSGGLTLASGSRIGGDGSFTGNLTLASGANLIFTPGSVFDVNGVVNLANDFSISSLVNADGSAIDWSLVTPGTYTLLGTTTSDFSNITNFGLANAVTLPGGGGNTAYFKNGSLDLVVVPEPSTYALLAGGLGMLAFLRSRARSGKNKS